MAGRKKDVRMVIKLRSTESAFTYVSEKNRRNDPDRMELKKFCPRCRTHTDHRETR